MHDLTDRWNFTRLAAEFAAPLATVNYETVNNGKIEQWNSRTMERQNNAVGLRGVKMHEKDSFSYPMYKDRIESTKILHSNQKLSYNHPLLYTEQLKVKPIQFLLCSIPTSWF